MNSYESYSKDLSQIADRRRVGLWINRRDYEIVGIDGKTLDIQVITPLTDPFLLRKLKPDTIVVLDIVDGYLVEKPPFAKDYARYFLRSSKISALKHPKKFSESLRDVCTKVDLIVVASEEQANIARAFNENIAIIRDSHDELGGPMPIKKIEKHANFEIFWEGLGFTISHFREAAIELEEFLLRTNSTLNLVTNETFPRFAGKFGKTQSRALIKDIFGPASKHVRIHPWSQEKVIEVARKCDFGIIPILESDDFGRLKPENKLLIYWRLGLQTLFSDTPSYVRLSEELGVTNYSVRSGEWDEKLGEIIRAEGYMNGNITKVEDYLSRFHSQEVILDLWKKALQSVKPKIQSKGNLN